MRLNIESLNNLVWGPWLPALLMGSGIYFMIKLKFLPIRRIPFAFRWAFGNNGHSGIGISPFKAFMTELASTIGIGNISGVASAMLSGGPGAVFWMMISALLGMSIKLVESTLSVKYRIYNEEGEPVGGPMITLKRAFQNKAGFQTLGVLYCFLAVLVSFGMGNMVQAKGIYTSLCNIVYVNPYIAGVLIGSVTLFCIVGGIKAVSRITGYLVPCMGLFYITGCILVIMKHYEMLPGVGMDIVRQAFSIRSVEGGMIGTCTASLFNSLRYGVARGVFSNEAGLGTGGITAACAHTEHPVKQGYVSMLGVVFDTLIMCFISAITLGCSGILQNTYFVKENADGTNLMIKAFETVFYQNGGCFLSICIILFAFATIIGWSYQGEKAFETLLGNSGKNQIYRALYGFTAFLGTIVPLEFVWQFSDLCNGLLVIPNMICMLCLSKGITKEIIDFDIQLKRD